MNIPESFGTTTVAIFDGMSESDMSLGTFSFYHGGWLRFTSTGRSMYIHIRRSDYDAWSVDGSYHSVRQQEGKFSSLIVYYKQITFLRLWEFFGNKLIYVVL